MSTAAAPSSDIARSSTGLGIRPLAGFAALYRFGLRRERLPLLAWTYGIVASVAATVVAFRNLYPNPAERAQFAESLRGNPVFTVITGPIWSSSIGGLTAWRMGLLGSVLAALAGIFTVVRRTRSEEESGRAELLASTPIGRGAALAAALACAGTALVGIGVLVAVVCVIGGEPLGGSALLGAVIAGPGLVFAGLAAVTAQVFDSARSAMGAAGALLGLSFAIRGVADSGSTGLQWLRWASPLGWTEEVRAFAGNRVWVVALTVALAVALVAVAFALLAHRDVGLSLLPARPGPATGRLRSVPGLMVRSLRGTAIAWCLALLAYGAVNGAIVDSADGLLSGSAGMREALTQLGGAGVLTQAVLSAVGTVTGLLASIAAISVVGRLAAEENSGRAELLLSTAVTRFRLQSGYLVPMLLIPAAALTLSGLACGLVHGIRSDGAFGPAFRAGLQAMMVQIPVTWTFGALAALVHALRPSWWPAIWAVFAGCVLLTMIGPSLQLPQWLLDVSPLTHVTGPAVTQIPWTAVGVLLVMTAALLAVAAVTFRRRDVLSR